MESLSHASPSRFRDGYRALRLPNPLLACIIFAAAGLFAADRAQAQVCSVPAAISPNTSYVFDTCQGDHELALACGLFPLAGPATVIRLNLPYPAGEVMAQSLDARFQPTMFLLQSDCRNDAPCSAIAQSGPGTPGLIDLSAIDSGNYFLVIAADGSTGDLSCGLVNVTASLTVEQEASLRSGAETRTNRLTIENRSTRTPDFGNYRPETPARN